MTNQDLLRTPAARRERRTSLLLGAVVVFIGSAGEPLYRAFDGTLFAIRMVWLLALVGIALALPRASRRWYGILLPAVGVSSSWLFALTIWLNGGIASPDFQYIILMPLTVMVLVQDEVIAVVAVVVATIFAVAMLAWLCDAPVSIAADNLISETTVGGLAIFGAFSFRRVRLAELATQRARTEAIEQLALSEHRRAQAERLAALGQLAAGVAHEINNPLYTVSSNVELLTGEAGLDAPELSSAEARGALADIAFGVARITQIVRDLKEFSSGGIDKLQPCEVAEVIGDALRLAAFRLGKSIEVRQSCDPDLPPVTVNRRKLSQVLLNLLVNAAEAMGDAGTEKPWVLVAAARHGGSVQIAVQDNGPGIPAEVAARLFEPFVTSKPIGKGTGLGLALSREYVTSFGGVLEHQPIAEGARFAIVLPATT